ncbi:phage tail tube protein [Aminicella lysinilytica]|uniref:Uncharacterized protein n=1 Tax=Aminicella lysinilytica TaxID=433323 RepID=A0A4R6QEH0_9FIRM|nr:phage tail protein [Aminicella lysinilytica]TDP59849.1 hypothetical protein EV211_10291 [Aminicella lysinilytica]
MATNTANVSVGKPKVGGAISYAATTVVLPTDAHTDLATGFKNLGYVSEDGVTNSNSPETESIKAWGGDVVANPQTGKDDTFQYTLIESLNSDVPKSIYGDANVIVGESGAITIKANSGELPEQAWIIDMILHGDKLKRTVIPKGQITEIGDIVYVDNEPIGYPLTISAHPDADGNTHYEYIE